MFQYLDSIESSTSFSDHVRCALEHYVIEHPHFELSEFRRFSEEFADTIGNSKATGKEAQERGYEVEVFFEQLNRFGEQKGNGPTSTPHSGVLEMDSLHVFDSNVDDF